MSSARQSTTAPVREHGELPLLQRHPALKRKLPHVALATLPTPVTELSSISGQHGLQGLYIKRDDLSGNIYGSNKVRKLEFLLGEALKKGVQEVFTFGYAGSNHALATAIYAKQLGISCTSFLLPQLNAHYVRRNLLAGQHFNARLCHCQNFAHLFSVLLAKSLSGIGKNGRSSLLIPNGASCPVSILGRIQFRLKKTRDILQKPQVPMIIPAGGTCPLGIMGYVNGAFELQEQIMAGILPEPDLVYVPMGSMGTATGLIIGLKAAGVKSRVVPVRVIEKNIAGPKKMLRLARRTLALLHKLDPSFPKITLSIRDFAVRDDCLGPGYGHYTSQAVEAAEEMRRGAGIVLNGTYSAKAFSAVLTDAKNAALTGKKVLFWNTYNSKDLSFAVKDEDYQQLPQPFHRYFEEEVQPLDINSYDR